MVDRMPALNLISLETACEAEGITLVMHPAVRSAVRRYEVSFYIGASTFLRGESDGLYFLPLENGYVRLRLSTRISPMGHPILRIDPSTVDGLARIKADRV
jgi:hypothetical protein